MNKQKKTNIIKKTKPGDLTYSLLSDHSVGQMRDQSCNHNYGLSTRHLHLPLAWLAEKKSLD